jgi:hypothetical protein
MKKILCMALTLVLALSLMTVPVLAADSGSATISVTASKSTLAVGDTVTYTISITGGAGLTGMSFDLGLTGLSLDKYDFLCLGEDMFRKDFSIGDETATLVKLTGSGNAYTFYATGTKNITGVVGDSWDILTLTCKATEAVADAAKALTLSNTSLYTSKPTSTGSAQEIDVSSTVTYGAEGVQTLLGDVDGDGMVTGIDALYILRYEVGMVSGNEINVGVGDVDGDGMVTGIDALYILRYEVGMITSFPAETN